MIVVNGLDEILFSPHDVSSLCQSAEQFLMFIRFGRGRERKMLKTRLKALGIDPKSFSESLLNDLIEVGTTLSTMKSEDAVEGIAVNVAWICFGEGGHAATEIAAAVERGYPHVSVFWEILAQHDPKRFALSELETTQYVSRLARDGR